MASSKLSDADAFRFFGLFVLSLTLAVLWYGAALLWFDWGYSRLLHLVVLAAPVPVLGAFGALSFWRTSPMLRVIAGALHGLIAPFLALQALAFVGIMFSAASGNAS